MSAQKPESLSHKFALASTKLKFAVEKVRESHEAASQKACLSERKKRGGREKVE